MRFAVCLAAALAAVADARPPAAWVKVTGQVLYVPEPGEAPRRGVAVNLKNAGLKDAVVWMRPDALHSKAAFAPGEVHPADAKRLPRAVLIDYTPRLAFEPRVVAARPGDTVVVRNLAPVPLDFFWSGGNKNPPANVVIPAGGQFRPPGPLVAETNAMMFDAVGGREDGCGVVRVFDHPYFAVTDADGTFELRDAPAGTYRLVIWHDAIGFRGGRESRFGDRVEIAPGKDGPLALAPATFGAAK
jgi:hypothetical protein